MATALEPFQGHETLQAAPEAVFAAVTDPYALAVAMPGLVSAQRVDERTARAVVQPGLSFVASQVRLTLRIAEATSPQFAAICVEAQSVGVSMTIDATLRLEPGSPPSTTQLNWTSHVSNMKGLITAVPVGLIRAAAQRVITEGWARLRQQIEGAKRADGPSIGPPSAFT